MADLVYEITFALTAASSALIYAFVSPEWAIPANTFLLILLAIVNRRVYRDAKEVKETAKESHAELISMANNKHDPSTRGRESD